MNTIGSSLLIPIVIKSAAVLLLMNTTSTGTVILNEEFTTNVPVETTGLAFTSAYPHFSFSGPGEVGVQGGELITKGNGMQVTVNGIPGALGISANLGFEQLEDLWAGMVVGQNTILLGFPTGGLAGQLMIRVDGPDGFVPQIAPFPYSPGTPFQIEIQQMINGMFHFTLSNSDSPNLAFEGSFNNIQSVGGSIGLATVGNSGKNSRFDNLLIQSIPEPNPTLMVIPASLLSCFIRFRFPHHETPDGSKSV